MKKAMTAAAILSLGTLAQAQPIASATLVVGVVADSSVELRLGGDGRVQAPNGFQSRFYLISWDYFALAPGEEAELADSLDAWADAPHSITAFARSSGATSFSAIGSAFDPSLEPCLVLNIYTWTSLESGHHHGGVYAALTVSEVRALAAALRGKLQPGALLYTLSLN